MLTLLPVCDLSTKLVYVIAKLSFVLTQSGFQYLCVSSLIVYGRPDFVNTRDVVMEK